MAQFNTGIKFDSDATTSVPSSATFAGLRGSVNANDNDFLATQAGAMVLSLRPEAQSSSKTVPLIEGKFVDVTMDYSNDGASVRFLIKAEGSTTLSTAYVAAGAAHTLALSYDAKVGGSMFYALDGVGAAVPGAFGANFDADSAGSGGNAQSVVFAPSANFDGHLSAIAFFQEFLSEAEVTRLSNDPESWITNLSRYDAPELNWPVPAWDTSLGSTSPLTGLLGGNDGATLEPVSVNGQGVQVLTVKPGLLAGDKITLSVPNAGYSPKTYTVLAADVANAAVMPHVVAQNLVKFMQGKLGTDVILNYGKGENNAGTAVANKGTVVITGSNDFLTKPVVLTYTNAAQFTESALQYLYDFRLVSSGPQQPLTSPVASGLDPNESSTTTTFPASGLAAGNARVALSTVSPSVTFNQGGTTTTPVTPTATGFTVAATTGSTAGAVSNGPIYAQIKSVATANSVTTATYNLYIDPGLDTSPGGFNTFGFTAKTSDTFKDFIPAPFTDARVNNANANEITVQWLKTTPEIDYSKSIGELSINLTPPAGATLTFSNISVDSTFYMNAAGTAPLVVEEGVVTDRHQLAGVVNQLPYSASRNAAALFTEAADPDSVDPIPLANTIAAYEVADALGPYGAKLRLKAPLNPTEKAGKPTEATATAVFEVVVQANTTAYDLKLELPFSAGAITWTPATEGSGTGTQQGEGSGTGTQQGDGTGTQQGGGTGTQQGGGTDTQQGRLYTVAGTTASSASEKVIGELSVNLNLTYGLGVDFEFATTKINGLNSAGRPTHVGVTKANDTTTGQVGKFFAKNLPVGEIKVTLLDTLINKPTTKVTLEDARAVLELASAKAPNIETLAGPGLGYSPSDLIAADFNKDGRVTSADALEIIKYVAQVTKTTPLQYVFLDNINNDPSATTTYAGGLTNVIVPPMVSRLTNAKYITPETGSALSPPTLGSAIGDGPTIHYVGVLIGDVV